MTSRSDDSPLRAAALAYARRGWPVFPLKERDKVPLTRRGFLDAVPNERTTPRQAHDIILAWWTMWPTANIGLATGHAFDVLDLDGPEGLSAFLDLVPGYNHNGPISFTGKGFHLLFPVTGSGNRAKLREAPIDFRGEGGYIVAPPSVHPLGHEYRWAKGRNENTAMAETPQWLLDLVGRDRDRQPVTPTAIVRDRRPPEITEEKILTKTGHLRDGRPDIVATATQMGLDPRSKGRYHVIACPYHDDSTPSLALYSDNTFHCFGCSAHGDSLDLLAKRDMTGKRFLNS